MAAIVIVTYNSEEVIGACLDSCLRVDPSEVLVVDNASSDGTVQAVRARPEVRLVASSGNLGFAGGVNLGFRSTADRHVLLLNPDAALQGSLLPMESLLEAPGVGAVTGQLIGEDGESQHAFHIRRFPTPPILCLEALGLHRLWPSNPVNRSYRSQQRASQVEEVEQPAGAFLLIKRTVWEELRGFDESFYPVWFEDVDFCKRLHQAGHRILYQPAVSARHLGGHSAASMPWEVRHEAWYGSLLRYTAKHFHLFGRLAVTLCVCMGSLVRCLARSWVVRNLAPMTAFVRVVRKSAVQHKLS